MRFHIVVLLFAILAIGALAVAPQKAVIVTYSEETPPSVMEEAMAEIEKAGGRVTHVYQLIKGFAAKATNKSLEAVKAMHSKYLPDIQEDSIVSVDGDIIENGHVD